MGLGALTSIGSLAFKAVGGHLFKSKPISKFEGIVSGLGFRASLLVGIAFGIYLTNSDFRGCISSCVEVLTGLIKQAF